MHQNIAEQLWQLLDDVDTLSDVLKPASTSYTVAVNTLVAKRHLLLKTDGHRLYWPPGQVAVSITGHEESRTIAPQRDEEGTVIGLAPVPGSERVALSLTLPNGQVIKAQVDPKDFQDHVVPAFLAARFPEAPPTDGFSLLDPASAERLPAT